MSGTDCFGSPINEGYRKLVEACEFDGTIEDYVMRNHEAQKRVLDAFDISLDIFDGSNIAHAGEVHQQMSEAFITRLYEKGWLQARVDAAVLRCGGADVPERPPGAGPLPVQGCKSEHGYADECDLGHQYAPADLIAPKSSITGAVPEMRPLRTGISTCRLSRASCASTSKPSRAIPPRARSSPKP